METEFKGLDSVKEYYGKVLKTSQDLKTSACCSTESMPLYLRNILKEIHDEVKEKFYGCGSPIPSNLEGMTVLDLGSGSGRDCFLLSKLVGPNGRVIGVDMTEEQIEVAERHINYHTKKFGFQKPNISFIKGYIEDLESTGVKNNSVDLVTSNCVINLSPCKDRVFSEVFRVLKPGGEFYFSDVFSNRRVPAALKNDDVFVGECLGGALYLEDFRRMMQKIGCNDYRLMTTSKIDLIDEEMKLKAGLIEFYSMTVRAFKLELEDRCEDHGQIATYLGTISKAPNAFVLDDHHTFETGKPIPVCGNTALMLEKTRHSEHFKVVGNMSQHFGLFDCSPVPDRKLEDKIGACC
ncbi:MAG: methyltransferase domain-containing protein [Bdellovibrionales bacterium]|nr:methyltransferase domain-containing protein [Bdellovibrionales bacterium]